MVEPSLGVAGADGGGYVMQRTWKGKLTDGRHRDTLIDIIVRQRAMIVQQQEIIGSLEKPVAQLGSIQVATVFNVKRQGSRRLASCRTRVSDV